MTKKINNPNGFTLVELIVVIAIIGVLAAVTSPAIGNMIDRARSRTVARGIANQYRLARNQAASTNQAFVVRLYPKGTTMPLTVHGRVEVYSLPGNPPNCRAVDFSPGLPPIGANLISFFEIDETGSDMLIHAQSHTGNQVSTVCVQPNGEFLEVSTGAKLNNDYAASVCLGETMVIPMWRNQVGTAGSLYGCTATAIPSGLTVRAQFDYWRITMWDNGQVTASRR